MLAIYGKLLKVCMKLHEIIQRLLKSKFRKRGRKKKGQKQEQPCLL